MHIVLFSFSPPFVGLLAELSLDKVCHYCIWLNFLSSGKFAAPLWVPAYTILVCGEAGSDQSELLCVGNFQGLSAGTADGPLDVIFLCPGSCLQFQRVHDSILLTPTCSACTGVKLIRTTINLTIFMWLKLLLDLYLNIYCLHLFLKEKWTILYIYAEESVFSQY